eukprot:scaffold74429_cov53-Prasinocladus_malaysianus.AAC.2
MKPNVNTPLHYNVHAIRLASQADIVSAVVFDQKAESKRTIESMWQRGTFRALLCAIGFAQLIQ